MLLLALGAACGGPSSSVEYADAPPAATDPSCPVGVPGTTVAVEDTHTGGALAFVTTGDVEEVAELRRRGRALATLHNEHHQARAPRARAHAEDGALFAHPGHGRLRIDRPRRQPAPSLGSLIGVPSHATPTDIDGGIQLGFLAAARDIAALQRALRTRAQQLGTGACHPPRG